MNIPKFANEAEEADWWYANRELVSAEFHRAAEDGSLQHGTAKRLAAEARARREAEETVRLDGEDVVRARAAATRKGLSYEAYVRQLVHEALEKESAA